MTKLTGPFEVASAGSTDGSVFKVSGNDVSVDGDLAAGGHTFAASALTLNVPTTGAGAAAASASTFLQVTVNGTLYHIPAQVSA